LEKECQLLMQLSLDSISSKSGVVLCFITGSTSSSKDPHRRLHAKKKKRERKYKKIDPLVCSQG